MYACSYVYVLKHIFSVYFFLHMRPNALINMLFSTGNTAIQHKKCMLLRKASLVFIRLKARECNHRGGTTITLGNGVLTRHAHASIFATTRISNAASGGKDKIL